MTKVQRAAHRLAVATIGALITIAHAQTLPNVGDTWRYRVQDQFRIGDLYMTAKVDGVSADGITETWTMSTDRKPRAIVVPLEPGFRAIPDWSLTPPQFAPYLQAAGQLGAGQPIGAQSRRVAQVLVPLTASVEGEEDVVVSAGRFRATKLVLRGSAPARGATRSDRVSSEHVVWYAPDVRRIVKYSVSTRVGAALHEGTVFELTDYTLN